MTGKTYSTLALETPADLVVQVTLNRPEVSNAFNTQMAGDIVDFFENLAMDAGGTRCVVITGAGSKAFCAGGDLKERDGMSNEVWNRQHLVYERMIRAIVDCPIPLIAAVNGAAFGGFCICGGACPFRAARNQPGYHSRCRWHTNSGAGTG